MSQSTASRPSYSQSAHPNSLVRLYSLLGTIKPIRTVISESGVTTWPHQPRGRPVNLGRSDLTYSQSARPNISLVRLYSLLGTIKPIPGLSYPSWGTNQFRGGSESRPRSWYGRGSHRPTDDVKTEERIKGPGLGHPMGGMMARLL